LPEQEKISEVLGCWDEGLESLGKLIDAKKLRKKGLMQRLLTGQSRLPGFGAECPMSNVQCRTPKGWKEIQLGDITQRVTRKNKSGCTNNLTISGANGLINQEEFFNKRVAAHDTSGYFLLNRGEFAYNKSYCNGYPLGAIKRLDRYEEGAVSTLYICFAIKDGKVDSNFMTQYFENGELNHEIYRVAQEGARNHGLLNITPTDFFDTKLILPTLDEQKAIAAVLETADEEIRLLEAERDALAEQKKGLMQKLLTGEVRMPQFRAA
jgi:type I restriction enzyme S subunit